MPSECLVYLIRDAGHRKDHDFLNALLPILLMRCEATLKNKIHGSKLPNAAYIRDEVLGDFAELFLIDSYDENNSELDYYECRFNLAFRVFYISIIRREISHLKKVACLSNATDDIDFADSDNKLFGMMAALGKATTPESAMAFRELVDAINDLPPNERQAVVLCHIMGYKQESEDPLIATAATRCGVTGRTIRNRLSRAAEMLSKFKEGN